MDSGIALGFEEFGEGKERFGFQGCQGYYRYSGVFPCLV